MSADNQETKQLTPYQEQLSGTVLLTHPTLEYQTFHSQTLHYCRLKAFYQDIQDSQKKNQLEGEAAPKCLCLVMVGISRLKEARNKSQFMRVYFTDLQKYKPDKSLLKLRKFQNDLVEGYLQISAFFYKPALKKILQHLQIGSVWLIKDPKVLGFREKLELSEENEENLCYVGMAKDFSYCEEQDNSGKRCLNFVNSRVQKQCDMHKRIKEQNLILSNNRMELNGGMALIDPSRLFGGSTTLLKPRKMTAAAREDFFGEDSVKRFRENLRRCKREQDEKKRGEGKLNLRQEQNKQKSEEFLRLRSRKFQNGNDLMGKLEQKVKQDELEMKEQIERRIREKKEKEKEFALVVDLQKECKGVDVAKVMKKGD